MSETNNWGVLPSEVGTRSLMETRTKAYQGVRKGKEADVGLTTYIVSRSITQVEGEIWIGDAESFGSSAYALTVFKAGRRR